MWEGEVRRCAMCYVDCSSYSSTIDGNVYLKVEYHLANKRLSRFMLHSYSPFLTAIIIEQR